MLHIDTWSFQKKFLRIILTLQVSYNNLIHFDCLLFASINLEILRARVLIIIRINCIVSNIKIIFQCGNKSYNIAHDQHRIHKDVFKVLLQSIERYWFWSSSCCSPFLVWCEVCLQKKFHQKALQSPKFFQVKVQCTFHKNCQSNSDIQDRAWLSILWF